MIKYILLLACATAISGEDKWAWSSSNRDRDENQRNENSRNDKSFDRKERLEDLQDRYEVIEPTTKRPINQKPQQDDEYFGGSEFGNPNSQRFNFNGLNGGGGVYPQQGIIPQGVLPQGGYPQGVGGYPSAFNGQHGPIRGQYQPNLYGNSFGAIGNGHYPGAVNGGRYPGAVNGGRYPATGNGGLYPGAGNGGHYPGAVNGGHYPGAGNGGLYPGNGGNNHGIQSGQVPVLVGPGGPTGIIGRPGYGPNRAHPNNGILVGPGGPTGIIGRPTGPSGPLGFGGVSGYDGVNGYGGNFGPLGGHVGNVPGAFNGIGNGFAGPYRPSGPAAGIPYNSGSAGRPYAAEFDDYDNGVDKKKHVEKKSIDAKN